MPDAPAVFTSTGRRKTAVARVRMKPGTGQILVNGRTMVEYFPREVLHMRIQAPFEIAGAEGRWDVHPDSLQEAATTPPRGPGRKVVRGDFRGPHGTG